MGHQLSKQEGDGDDNNHHHRHNHDHSHDRQVQQQQGRHPLAMHAAKLAATDTAAHYRHHDLDGQSRSTATTVSSSVSPPDSPLMTKIMTGKSWNSSGHRSNHTGSHQHQQHNMTLVHWGEDENDYNVTPAATLSRATVTTGTATPSLPVKCPRPSSSSSSRRRRYQTTSAGAAGAAGRQGDGGSTTDDYDFGHEESASYIEQMYDMKSWDMFFRITQGRKQRDEQRQRHLAAQVDAKAASDDVAATTTAAAVTTEEGTCDDHDDGASPPRANQESSGRPNNHPGHATLSATDTRRADTAVPTVAAHQRHLPDDTMGSRLAGLSSDMIVDDEWENLGFDYDDHTYDENGVDTSESQNIFLFDL